MGFELLLAFVIATYITGRGAADLVSVFKGRPPPSLTRGGRAHHLAAQWLAYKKARAAYKAARNAGSDTKMLKPRKPHRFLELAQAVWDDRMINAKANHDRRVAERRERRTQIEAGELQPTPYQRFLEKCYESAFLTWHRAWERLGEWREKKTACREADEPGASSAPEQQDSQPGPQNDERPEDPQPPASDTAMDSAPPVEQRSDEHASGPADSDPQPMGPPLAVGGDAVNGQRGNESTNGRTTEMLPDRNGSLPRGTLPDRNGGSNGQTSPAGTMNGAGGSAGGGEINSQRKLALAEQKIAELGDTLLSKAEAIAASAEANGLDTDAINRGTERLRTMRSRWATESTEHDQAAVAATEVVAAHEKQLSADLDYDVAS